MVFQVSAQQEINMLEWSRFIEASIKYTDILNRKASGEEIPESELRAHEIEFRVSKAVIDAVGEGENFYD